MLCTRDLACSRGERRLFAGLSFALDSGEWLHVKGENGSGKTTLLRTLIGLSPPDEGHVEWRGVDTRAQAGEYRREFVYLGHAAGLKDELTPLENLRLALSLDGIAADDEALRGALRRVGLEGRESLPARVLSAGQRRRVLLARLLLRGAALWVLDEPFNALDTDGVATLCGMIQAHLGAGGVAVLTSHQSMPLPPGKEIVL